MKKLVFKRRQESEEMSLQITSMADIFTILLVFLLKSFATGAVNAAPSSSTQLPQAQAGEASIEALKVEVSEKAVLVEGEPVSVLSQYRFDAKDTQDGSAAQSLSKALDRERQRQLLIAKSNSDVKVDAKILVMADQRTPYETIKRVLASAAMSGYTDFKLAVVKEE